MREFVFFLFIAFVCGQITPPNMLAFFVGKETKLDTLEQAVRVAYATRGNLAQQCTASFSACKSDMKTAGVLSCEKGFGSIPGYVGCDNSRLLSMSHSVVRTALNYTTVPTVMKNEECWTRTLDTAFVANKNDATLRWQYFGTPHGFYRIYPGVAQEHCATYDPRVRPWYVAATSGPKDVVLVLDVSGSMANANRMVIMKAAAKQVVETLTIHDYVNVVVFSTQANVLIGTTLLQATTYNKDQLLKAIQNLQIGGSTNFEAGFRAAFSLFKGGVEFTSACNKALLFLTDGALSSGQNVPALYTTIATLNAPHNATVFSYSLGSGASQVVPHTISCQNNGMWTAVPDGGDLRGSMSAYYEYFALLRSELTSAPAVWVELYTDATGAGEMTTVSKAVYDTTVQPRRLMGVLGMDVLASDLRKLEANYDNLLQALVFRSNICPTLSVDECNLEYVRLVDFNADSDISSEINRLCGTTLNCTTPPRDVIPLAGYPDWRYVVAGRDYKSNTVCAKCIRVVTVVVGGLVSILFVASAIILVVEVRLIWDKKEKEDRNVEMEPT